MSKSIRNDRTWDNNDDGTGDNGDLGDSGYDSPIFTPPNDGSERFFSEKNFHNL